MEVQKGCGIFYLQVLQDMALTTGEKELGEIYQTKHTPFKDGILGKSCLHWFRKRHPNLVLRQAQGLERIEQEISVFP